MLNEVIFLPYNHQGVLFLALLEEQILAVNEHV